MSNKIPNHVGIIIDGNRRWAKKNGLTSFAGHKKGAENIRKMVKYIFNQGINYMSIFAFSTENFKRTAEEVNYLMKLFVDEFNKNYKELDKENIKIVFSGRRDKLNNDVIHSMEETMKLTENNTKGLLNICLNYGGQSEIVDASKRIANDLKDGLINIEDINEESFYKYLYRDLPPIDLLIRTSGEYRVSNFMLYQLAYAEFYFPEVTWPDFNEKEFDKALEIYNNRDRRFGGNSNEINENQNN